MHYSLANCISLKLSNDETELISYQEFLVIVYTKTLVVSE